MDIRITFHQQTYVNANIAVKYKKEAGFWTHSLHKEDGVGSKWPEPTVLGLALEKQYTLLCILQSLYYS